jgi:YHS domain-containing protein
MPVDPVLLRSGQEVSGDQRFTMEYDGTIYVFSTQRTLDTFRADPATYAAQQGGACGRMGPLGGLGDARRYAIQDNMLYFFASEECRRTFRENPRLYMEPRDIFPSGTPEQQTQGLAAIDRWVAWAGGKDAVKAATSFKHVSKKRVEQGAAEWDLTETLEIEGPRSMHRVDVWQKVDGKPDEVRRYELRTTPDSATIQGDMGYPYPLADSRRVSFERTLNRQPYAIMRARYRPEAGFLAIKTCIEARFWAEAPLALYSLPAECTALRPSSVAFRPSDRAS